MKQSKKTLIIIFIILFIFAASCARVVYKPRLAFGPSEAKWVKKTLKKMTLEEKIGQMVVCPYSGRFLNRDSNELKRLETLIVEKKIGGLILFRGEVYETAYLTNTLQKSAKIPLLIASDLERGLGNQIAGATQFPPLMALGAIGSEDEAYRMGKITALEARAIGIHLTYAPVVDVNINPENPIINTRSFGEDPEQVSRLSVAFIKGCQENGLLATAKHFPGHGDTDLDSHIQLPSVKGDRKRLEKVELYPFRRAIQAGVQVIMSSHLYLPALDPTPDLPATLSPLIMTDLLRKELGFKGLIVTDAMDMGGITTIYKPEEAALRAVQAGVDMILLPPEPEKIIEALLLAARDSQISEKRINISVERILKAKARLGLHKNRLVNIDSLDEAIGRKDHLILASQMFENSITLVKNKEQVLPLSSTEQKIAIFSLSSDPGGYYAGKTFVEEVEERCPESFSFFADFDTGEEFYKEAVEKSKEADIVIFALFSMRRAWKGSVGLEPRHIQLVKEAVQSLKRVVVFSFGSPYFLRHFSDVDSYLCVYRWSPQAQKTAAKALFREIDIKGRLPVSIPGLYPLGHGLNLSKRINSQNSF